MLIFHNSQEKFYRSPFGALKTGTELTLRIKVKRSRKSEIFLYYWTESSGNVRIAMNFENEQDGFQIYSVTFNVGSKAQLLWYNFRFEEEDLYYGNNEDGLGGEGKIYKSKPLSYQVTIYKEFKVPSWFKQSIVYQIFPDRFYRSKNAAPLDCKRKNTLIHCNWEDEPHYIRNEKGEVIYWDFFGGDLEGVLEKVDYLKKLGVNCLYFNPVFEAKSNHRYDTGNYHQIDPMLGTNKLFKKMTEKLEKKGIRIILDGVFSHTGADSIYFNKYENYDSVGAYNSQDSKYFNWYIFGKYPEKYDSWWGVKDLPNVDELEPSYRDFIYNDKDSVVRYWLDQGVYGWRLDVVDELPEQFIKEIRSAVKETKEDAVIIGEVWEDASNKVSYGRSREYLFGEELDSPTNYPLREALISLLQGDLSAKAFHRKIMSIYENYPRESFYSAFNILGSHDVERINSILSKNQLKAAVFFQMSFPGVPVIYYGDEAGLKGLKDPDNRRTYPWGREDKEVLKFYFRAVAMRKDYPVFVDGDFNSGSIGDNIYYFLRKTEDELALCVINNGNDEEDYRFELEEEVDFFLNFVDEKKYVVNSRIVQGRIKPGEIKILYKKKAPLSLNGPQESSVILLP